MNNRDRRRMISYVNSLHRQLMPSIHGSQTPGLYTGDCIVPDLILAVFPYSEQFYKADLNS